MKRYLKIKRRSLGLATLLAGGTVFATGSCLNTLFSITPCGTVVEFCDPGDQIALLWQWLEVPDYDVDPSCTIPYACGGQGSGTDLFPPVGGGAPFGGGSEPPSDAGGGVGGGGGGGGI